MSAPRKSNEQILEENVRLRAQVAQLEDRLDHLEEYGAAAKSLQQAEALHGDVMNAVSDVVLITDSTGRLTYVTPNCQLIFGHSATDMLRQGRIGYFLPANLFDPNVLEQRGEIANIECQIRDTFGRARDLSISIRVSDPLNGTLLYACRDVTERMKLELDLELLNLTFDRRVEDRTAELRESRERYRRYVEGLRGEYLFYATSPEGVMTYVSPSVHAIIGYTPDQVLGRNWRDFVRADDPYLPKLEEYERMRQTGVPTPPFLLAPVQHANGQTVMLEFTDMQLRDESGRIVANEGICRDITQRLADEEKLHRTQEELERRVEARTAELRLKNEQLQESELRYRTVVEDQLEFIVRWRQDGLQTFVNDAYCRYWNVRAAELVGGRFLTDMLEPDRDSLQRKLAGVTMEQPVVSEEHRVIRPDGRAAWQHWTHRAMFHADGKFHEFQSVGSDVSERRKREEHGREQVVAQVQLQSLSDRERDVMRLVVAGDANKIIARKLNLSVKTIEKHRSSLMKKLHVRSVPELVRLALLTDEMGIT